ncbi:histone H2A.Z-specific chaperone [Aspergillus brasiliensis]|uniref:Histone H2A.Z-specific chaperone n=1 Tax=Aspergillus brasiliensis TaxID=319629 RepID=A0A9W5YU21_9EURO|nr:histone H2A.Z-specific chaperone [Aspergillus brasiliensis]GKZ40561.1 histone H2A.Z-specific chaperone [Aspergillus brasiliensis]
MGDNNQATTGFDPAANAPDAAAWDKGKGKATEPTQDLRMDDDESEESEAEEMIDDDDEEDNDSLEPISADNIISGGRRTRGKNIDFQAAAEKLKEDDMDEDDDDDDDYVGAGDDDEDNKMRD